MPSVGAPYPEASMLTYRAGGKAQGGEGSCLWNLCAFLWPPYSCLSNPCFLPFIASALGPCVGWEGHGLGVPQKACLGFRPGVCGIDGLPLGFFILGPPWVLLGLHAHPLPLRGKASGTRTGPQHSGL